jgi:DNA-binding MarR family transcriptional regulator
MPAKNDPAKNDPAHDDVLADAVRRRFLRISQVMRRDGAALPLTTTQGAVLNLVRIRPMTVGELAKAEGMKPPSMTQIVQRMEEAGWVYRPSGSTRGSTVQATDAGSALIEQANVQRNAMIMARLAVLSSADRTRLEAALPVLDRIFAPVIP